MKKDVGNNFNAEQDTQNDSNVIPLSDTKLVPEENDIMQAIMLSMALQKGLLFLSKGN